MRWIKVGVDIARKVEMQMLIDRMGVSVHEAIGLCVAFWSWAVGHTDDGTLPGCTRSILNRLVRRTRFAEHLVGVGWLLEQDGTLVVPGFDRYMGAQSGRQVTRCDWLKVVVDLARKIEVQSLVLQGSLTDHEAVGLCVMFWSWADGHTDDGVLPRCTRGTVDRVVGRDGFAAGLLDVGWLTEDAGGLAIPNFRRHMGDSAKRRALRAERQQRWRKTGGH